RDAQPPAGSRHLTEWNEPPIYDQERLWRIVDELIAVSSAHDATPAQVALAWLLTRPCVTSVIVGARTHEQLADNLAAAHLQLSAADLRRPDPVSRAAPLDPR